MSVDPFSAGPDVVPPPQQQQPTAVPMPQAEAAPVPPTPVPDPTPGPLPLTGRGHPIASVEIIGQPVRESHIGALHLAEVIRYSDGTKPDIVGYDPEGRGPAHGGDPLFVETSLGDASAEAYIAAGKARYHLTIEPTPHQSLEEFVAHQEHAWKMYDRSAGVPRYDFAGNDVTYHNSNSAMVSSIREAGRGDVANRLQRDLEPPERMRELEQGPNHLSPEAASMRLAIERWHEGKPSAPGASHEMTRLQIEGLATPEPERQRSSLQEREKSGVIAAVNSFGADALRSPRERDLLDWAPGRDGPYFTLMRTDAEGNQSLQRKSEPFQMHGTILSADAERVTQHVGPGQTFTYKTDDLLQAAADREAALRFLERAAAHHELIGIKLGTRGLDLTTSSIERGQSYEHGR